MRHGAWWRSVAIRYTAQVRGPLRGRYHAPGNRKPPRALTGTTQTRSLTPQIRSLSWFLLLWVRLRKVFCLPSARIFVFHWVWVCRGYTPLFLELVLSPGSAL